jgi:hypothetical protein
MHDPDNLKAASSDEIAEWLSLALLYDRRRWVHDADRLLARIAAGRLVECLAAAGFVVIKRTGAVAPMIAPCVPCHAGSATYLPLEATPGARNA